MNCWSRRQRISLRCSFKGGDVFVFGRGGEEGLYLREHGISYTVVPGVTSAIAGPAYAGIPVTHRGVATSFRVITGHQKTERICQNLILQRCQIQKKL